MPGHKTLHLPFGCQYVHELFHVQRTEVILRLFQRKGIRLSVLFGPAQGKLRFHESLPAFTAIVNTNAVFRNIKTGFGTQMRARTDGELAGFETLINVGQLRFIKKVFLLTRGILQPVCLKSVRITASSATQASWNSIHILMYLCLMIIPTLWSLTESRLNVGIT